MSSLLGKKGLHRVPRYKRDMTEALHRLTNKRDVSYMSRASGESSPLKDPFCLAVCLWSTMATPCELTNASSAFPLHYISQVTSLLLDTTLVHWREDNREAVQRRASRRPTI